MKFFWFLFATWVLILMMGDSESEVHAYIRNATFVLLMFIGLAVYAIDKRIDRLRRQIQEPDFNEKAENWAEWFEVGRLVLIAIGILVLGTFALGLFRCLASDDQVTLGCIWEGTKEQIADDLN